MGKSESLTNLKCRLDFEILSNPTNVSKFGSADFQQQLSNRTDGTSSVKPRVRHYTSFPAILSATYATPAPTASATTLPAGANTKFFAQ
ncbi:neuronal PAS domain-containing protein 2 [Grus japonensis]|uniref:Neuronal PAS domain-containing protein 2 n=1 Tax=Grus japonensis TaxID=30415 RepID=A0ABC9VZW0_GRUJA